MTAILRETADAIWLGVWSNMNQSYVATAQPANRWVLASHYDTRWDRTPDTTNWIGCACPLPTEGVRPTTTWNARAAAEAVVEQRRTFGDLRPGTTGSIRSCDTGLPVFTANKKQIRSRELDRALSAAFAPRQARFGETLSLDTSCDYGWTPAVEDTSVEDADTTETTLADIYSRLNDRQRMVAELLIDGRTQTEIATVLGMTQPNVARVIKQMRARLA